MPPLHVAERVRVSKRGRGRRGEVSDKGEWRNENGRERKRADRSGAGGGE